MKLNSLKVTKAFGYLSLNIKFNDDVTFLVGPNGSGKTTVLRLIHAVLSPAFEEIYSIPFDTLILSIKDSDGPRSISIKRDRDRIVVSVDNIDQNLVLPLLSQEEIYAMKGAGSASEQLSELLRPILSVSPVYEYLSRLNSPMFLGLDRRAQIGVDDDRDIVRIRAIQRNLHGIRHLKGSLARGLVEVQDLAQEAYRKFRRAQESMTAKLRKEIVLSAFRYTEFDDFERTLSIDGKTLLARRDEISQTIEALEIGGADVQKQLNEFFSRIENLFQKNQDEREAASVELLANKAQIDRIEQLVKLIDSHRTETERVFSPIRRFIDAMSLFYADTSKKVEIDQVGAIKILRPDKNLVGIDALSSGERQLLVIFGHLFFNKYGSNSSIFIIDEPELSLHLRWQEIFVEEALKANPAAQLIFATHSPEIVSYRKEKAINLGIRS